MRRDMPYLNNQICNGGMIPQCSHKLKGLHCLFAHIQNTACRMTVLLVLKHQWWYRDGHVFCLHLPETQMLPCEDHNEKNVVVFFALLERVLSYLSSMWRPLGQL